MRCVVQRVSRAEVRIGHETVGAIEEGLMVLVGVGRRDSAADAEWMAAKLPALRIFRDDQDRMNRSLTDVGGAMLLVSQFTLHGDCRKGRRPSFGRAADPVDAERLFDDLVERIRTQGVPVETGRFGAMMEVDLVNDGPVTLIVESPAERA